MKRYWMYMPLTLSLLLCWAAGAQADWWIFGQSEEAVTIDYLYINQMTPRRIALSDPNVQNLVQEVLHQMVTAYEAEEPQAFMRHVAENFTGDQQRLDFAVRRDFSLFDNTRLSVSISNIATGADGYTHVSLSYTRFAVSTQSGQPLQDKGLTELIFIQRGELPQVYAMKYPLLFGISDSAHVASGLVVSDQNSQTLVVDDQGNAAVIPLSEAIAALENGAVIGGIAPPTLASISGTKRIHINLEISASLDFVTTRGIYAIIVEESITPNGPWEEADRRTYATRILNLTTPNVANQPIMLFYRVIIQHTGSGDKSLPSNVVQWDNT